MDVDIIDSGKRKNRTIGPGRENMVRAIRVAEDVARQVKSSGQHLEPKTEVVSNPRFIDFGWIWHKENENRWTPETFQRYEEILRLHLMIEATYRQPIDRVGRDQVKKHLRRLSKKRSPATVEAVHAVISGIFEEAIDDGLVNANPVNKLLKKILPPKHRRDVKQPVPLTVEEVNLLISVAEKNCSQSMRLILMVMIYMGLRLGEALAMRLRHLDFDKRLYNVVEAFKLKTFKKPKS